MSAYGEFTTVMSEERYLVEGLMAMGYRVFTRPPKSLLVTNRRPARATNLHDLKGRFGEAMERSLEHRGRREALGTRLEHAGIALRPGEYLVLGASAAAIGFLAGLLVGGVAACTVAGCFDSAQGPLEGTLAPGAGGVQ